jgi:hypothetical protein
MCKVCDNYRPGYYEYGLMEYEYPTYPDHDWYAGIVELLSNTPRFHSPLWKLQAHRTGFLSEAEFLVCPHSWVPRTWDAVAQANVPLVELKFDESSGKSIASPIGCDECDTNYETGSIVAQLR